MTPRWGWADWACLLGLLAYALGFVALTSGGYADADDRYYLAAADAWRAHGLVVGTAHWALRLPLVLAMAGSMAVGGRTEVAVAMAPAMACVAVLMGATFVLLRPFGRGAAVLAGVLAASTPVVAIYGRDFGPDLLEAALCAASFAVFMRAGPGRRVGPMVAAGLLLGVAWVDRATAAPLLGVYGIAFLLAGPGRWRMAPLFVAFAVPVVAELVFYAVEAGSPFYRFGVDAGSLEIPSNHMVGQVAGGLRPPFNWRLMARWRPNSLVDVHWALNPFIDLVTNPQHGWLALPALVAGPVLWRGTAGRPEGWMVRALCMWAGLIMFVVLVLLNLRPQPRYFLTLTWIAAMLVALEVARLPGWWRRVACAAVGAVLVLDLLAAQYRPDPVAAERAMVRRLRGGNAAVWTTPEHGATMALLDARVAGQVHLLPAPPGAPCFLTAAEAEAAPYRAWAMQARLQPDVPWPLRLVQPLALALHHDLRARGPDGVVVVAPG